MATINGSNFNDNNTINGSPSILRPALNGGADNDILNGNGGNDILNGNASSDILNGGTGSDILNGGAGSDVLDGGADNDVLNGGADRDVLNGGSGNDILDGGNSSDILDGGAGNDTLIGGADGSDTFIGSEGNDSIDGGEGFDTINYRAVSQRITLSGVGTVRKAGGLGQDTLFRVENIIANSDVDNNTIDASQSLAGVFITVNLETRSLVANNVPVLGRLPFTVVDFDDVIGTNANDSIVGDDQNNQLSGGNGNDTINGGNGTDRLTGGLGNDIFDFNSVFESQPGASRDVITDFLGNGNLAGDQIDLSTIDANPFLANDQAFTFIGTAAFSAVGQIRYSGGILQANTNFDFSPELEIQLVGAPGLVASDIIV
ncbi:hypothetical protein H6G97_01800 [Nostoc flagelliforme FACHB-838]|uniref:Calcium-binding protein n=1 Tax=Nostoc flagelliforme FACHB-838 TaxID=2692904 RepID=A0ABR8DHC2_9NOSO|nr:calcium-binding protein [Nostoc flagelliforme]MBD2528356.1 hypothetical protein [Nostoc flagelliforme FACHB-838]